jgi:hypothetical protein
MDTTNPSNYYHFPHVTKQDYDRAFNTARLEVLKDPELLRTSVGHNMAIYRLVAIYRYDMKIFHIAAIQYGPSSYWPI